MFGVSCRDVWASNLEEEFKQICRVVEKFPFVAMDTEFPGVVARYPPAPSSAVLRFKNLIFKLFPDSHQS
jgi:hypothetical protein